MQPKFLVVGKVLRPHGVRGELRVKLLTNYPDRFRNLEHVVIGNDPEDDPHTVTYEVERARLHRQHGILKLADIDERDAAEALRDQLVMVLLEDAVPLDDDEYYFFQLVGLTMVTDEGETLGEVIEVLETGANEVYLVNGPRYGELLIPAIESVVKQIDLENQQIVITPLPGLLP